MPDDPATGLDQSELLALGAVLASMQRSNVQIRRPSVNRPPYWGQSFALTTVVPMPPSVGPGWADLIVVPSKAEHYTVITGYSLGCIGSLATSGLAFQFINNDAVMTNQVDIPAGIDLNRTAPTSWPMRVRDLRLVLPMTTRFALQFRNTALTAQYAICGLFGYYAAARDATILDWGGVTDA